MQKRLWLFIDTILTCNLIDENKVKITSIYSTITFARRRTTCKQIWIRLDSVGSSKPSLAKMINRRWYQLSVKITLNTLRFYSFQLCCCCCCFSFIYSLAVFVVSFYPYYWIHKSPIENGETLHAHISFK